MYIFMYKMLNSSLKILVRSWFLQGLIFFCFPPGDKYLLLQVSIKCHCRIRVFFFPDLCGENLIIFLSFFLQKFVTWPRGLRFACACYLASVSIPPPETKTPWVARAPKNKDPLKWYIMACSRLSQTGEVFFRL